MIITNIDEVISLSFLNRVRASTMPIEKKYKRIIYGGLKTMRHIPNISGFTDFCSYHANGEPIYFVNNKLYAGFDMLVRIDCRYNFLFSESKKETENAIMENMYMFDIEETNKFYYPNDNMFSGDNSIDGIKGQILTLKKQYR